MDLLLETTTGLLSPSGTVAQLARGPAEKVRIRFATNGVVAALGGSPEVTLDLFDPADTENPVLTIEDFQAPNGKYQYVSTFDVYSGALAAVQKHTYLARINYGEEQSELFHLKFGGGSAGSAPRGQASALSNTDNFKDGYADIGNGANSVGIEFPSAFASAPRVTCQVLKPDGNGANIAATVREDTITVNGFTAELTGPAPAAGHRIYWQARL